MINIYDGNNVLMRALSDTSLHAANGMNLRQRYHSTLPSDIWVFDGHGHNKRRQEIYTPYKMNRTPPAANIFAQIKLFKELLRYSHGTLIEVPGWEADDVIGALAKKGPMMRVHTNDMDYAQLLKLPNVLLNGVKTKDVEARWIPLYKATVGDSSDNIAGIPGFGPGAWEALKNHREDFEGAIVSGLPNRFTAFPITPRVTNWLTIPENVKLLQNMLLITHFFPVPEDEIDAGITPGVYNPEAAETLLHRYLL